VVPIVDKFENKFRLLRHVLMRKNTKPTRVTDGYEDVRIGLS